MRAGNCRHFTGMQNEKCKAGVCYRPLVGGPDLGWAAHLPCLPNSKLRQEPLAKCEKFDAVTQEEEAAWRKENDRRFKVMGKAISAIRALGKSSGTIVCPECGTGNLRFTVAKLNGHIWGRCSTEGCLAWMM